MNLCVAIGRCPSLFMVSTKPGLNLPAILVLMKSRGGALADIVYLTVELDAMNLFPEVNENKMRCRGANRQIAPCPTIQPFRVYISFQLMPSLDKNRNIYRYLERLDPGREQVSWSTIC